MTVELWKAQIVLRRIAEGVFEDEDTDTIFRLDMPVYVDMGCPETITLTVVPGAHAEDHPPDHLVKELREACGLPLPVGPKEAWDEAVAVVRRVCGKRPIDQFFDEFDPDHEPDNPRGVWCCDTHRDAFRARREDRNG